MRLIPISLPTPFYIGPVNVYLIAEDPITIYRHGSETKEAIAALRSGLRAAGFRVSDIQRIVLTHAHEDHCGLARSLRDEAKNARSFSCMNGKQDIATAGSNTLNIAPC